jgi:hypothetical protein
MITTRAVPALLPAYHRRVAPQTTVKNDFADPLAPCPCDETRGPDHKGKHPVS